MLRSVKVRDYMTTNLVVFSPETELFEAIHKLLKNSISGAPVVDGRGNLVGILSEVDCLKSILSGSYYDYESLGGTVAEYMTVDVDIIGPEEDILAVSERFINDRRRRFPVVEEGKLVGQISRKDVLRAVSDFVAPQRFHQSA
ncbi:CBS domain-containing protein [Hahella aquimaris]|uniref:CBS domain-containing protein n=1 Tax=Hahella sp. HNIBRBA332 TaxID=3015983 RepID=UPI00273BFF2F|nr:CBS domain-containing protein [Hahella sp. HNIBRBA332]WLQ14874.1 CBS domain-containing protein [Hahella sp. HNIBRBA332]